MKVIAIVYFNVSLVNFFEHVICAAENDSTSSKTGGVADLPSLRISTKVAVSKHINLQPETDPVTPSKEVSTLISISSSFKQ